MLDKLIQKFPISKKVNEYNFTALLIFILFIYEKSWPITVPRPFTIWVSLVVVFMPGIWRLGKIILSQAGFCNATSSILTPAITIAIWLASIHVTGLICGNFYYSLIISNIILGVTGYLLPARLIKFEYQLPDRKHVLVALLNCLIISPVIFLTDWHDTNLLSGHFSLPAEMLNGAYPPHHLTFAEYVHPSHYGVDTLYAAIAAIFALSVESSVDLTSFLLWFYTGLLGGYICKELFGEKNGTLGVFISCFASGFPLFSMLYAGDLMGYIRHIMLGLLTFTPPYQANQPISHFFFQRPWAIGIPFFLSFIIVLFIDKEKNTYSKAYYGIIALIIFILGISNTTLFLTTIGAFGGCVFLQFFLKENKHIITGNLFTLIISIIAFIFLSGSYHVVSGGTQGTIMLSEKPIAGSILHTILWNFDNLGLLLTLAFIGLYKLKGQRIFQIFCLFIITGSLFIINFLIYKYSHDIIKFSVVANIIAAILAVGSLDKIRNYNVYIYRALLIIICFNGVIFPFIGTLINPFPNSEARLNNVIKLHNVEISPDSVDTMAWLRANIKNTDIVLQIPRRDLYFAMLAGLPSFHPDWGTKSFNFPREHLALREDMFNNPEKYQVSDFYKQGVRWLVVNIAAKGEVLLPLAQKWEATGSINNVQNFGNFKIYQLSDLEQ